ncbi:MAG: protein translocase subunit SecF [Ruminococcus sp.]|nr:protein translocase subunit SecF [Ruminococcus sp.]
MSKKDTQKEVVLTPKKVYNFCSKKKLILGVVIGVLVVFIAGAIINGIHLAIEFKGGTLITYTYQGEINTNDVASTVKDIVGSSVVVRTGESLDSGGRQVTISFTSDQGLTVDRQTELTTALREKFAENDLVIYDSNDVNPASGREFLLKCFIAVLFAAFIVIIYIAIRFKNIGGWSAGVCSIFALCLDLLVAFTATIVCGFNIDSNIVAVFLTILGYSINNTIVIYDRIRENRKLMPKASLNELINVSCTQSLTRSIRTSITTIGTMLIVTIVVMVTGYDSLLSFSVPLMMGLISGTFSSLFVAPVTWSWWMNKRAAKEKKSK